ncbi:MULTISPECIES: ferredoxin reductase [unclassified Nocardioides]|uniref:ferredoxin reductase n=1 Tax=unclassified Nocardioides TaxID=2615069 RepID=UPI001151E237|nr:MULTISPECIES: ferredoxin reductase [unclassified Nocardioides]TQK69231.1 ferredoxin-NADP reductase [Nocardioides sp. SLBN-35]WGY01466.1 ferredoxin reductase [Nocardioides sp. QY071]
MSTTTAAPDATARTGRLRTGFRSLLDAAVTPLSVDDLLDHFAPLRPGAAAGLQGRIVSVAKETEDAATLVIKPGRDWAGHIPGQYVRVGVDVDGIRLWRTYSLTHGPRRDGHISITVKAIPDGAVSQYLVREARAGQMIQLAQAEGDFVLTPPAAGRTQKLLLVTAGSGITPVIGMLRNLYSRDEAQARAAYDIVLVHSAMKRDEVIFGAELRAHAEAGRLRLIERHTDTDGLLTTDDLEAEVPDLAERTAYACGPAGLLDSLEAFYDDRRLTLHTERFRPTVVDVDAEGGTLTFAGSAATTVETDGSVPILDAAESAGVLMPSGCRMGICMGCVLPMKSGAVRDLRTGELTVAVPGETHPDGVKIQTCISAAAGDCTLDH